MKIAKQLVAASFVLLPVIGYLNFSQNSSQSDKTTFSFREVLFLPDNGSTI
jgi:hypothetical protein